MASSNSSKPLLPKYTKNAQRLRLRRTIRALTQLNMRSAWVFEGRFLREFDIDQILVCGLHATLEHVFTYLSLNHVHTDEAHRKE